MFLMIKNAGIAAVEAFTVLGLSTARGDANKLGQFGSGSKHAINVLLRNRLQPVIYLGKDELTFFTVAGKMGEKEYDRVFYRFQDCDNPTGMALEFGGLDWDSVQMALREFVSNALDQGEHEIRMVDNVAPYDDATTIYIPATDEVQNYFKHLPEYFLQFKGLENVRVLSKPQPSKARIYRKGVFVREINELSMFDYNFGDEVKIDEARNMDDNVCRTAAAQTLCKHHEQMVTYFKSLSQERSLLWEDRFASWDMPSHEVRRAWEESYGDAAVCSTDEELRLIRKNGHNGVVVKHNRELVRYSIPQADDLKAESQRRGVMECKPTATMRRTFKKVWNKIQSKGMTKNKPMPELVGFTKPTDADGDSLCGFYDPRTNRVYINVENEAQYSTHIEEIAHYVTGACDGSRTFQDYAFQLAALWGFR